jgi:hypothetical protein
MQARLPSHFSLVKGKVNIERKGKGALRNDYLCREEGCGWTANQISDSAARNHAKAHSSVAKCHIFEDKPVEQVVAELSERRRARNHRHRFKKKQQVRVRVLLLLMPHSMGDESHPCRWMDASATHHQAGDVAGGANEEEEYEPGG